MTNSLNVRKIMNYSGLFGVGTIRIFHKILNTCQRHWCFRRINFMILLFVVCQNKTTHFINKQNFQINDTLNTISSASCVAFALSSSFAFNTDLPISCRSVLQKSKEQRRPRRKIASFLQENSSTLCLNSRH